MMAVGGEWGVGGNHMVPRVHAFLLEDEAAEIVSN